jgi:CAP-Gly domain-containing linker protein 1
MSSTPGKPRQSGIPTPGRPTGIPTPGRSRSTSIISPSGVPKLDTEFASRTFAEAIKANDPAQHRPSRVSDVSSVSLSPQTASLNTQSGRRSVAGRPSSAASSSSGFGSSQARVYAERPRTPNSVRPPSRQSEIHGRNSSRTGRAFDVGDSVRIESKGYEGTLRYIGEIHGKAGFFAGVELSGGFYGMGKNDGTVDGCVLSLIFNRLNVYFGRASMIYTIPLATTPFRCCSLPLLLDFSCLCSF